MNGRTLSVSYPHNPGALQGRILCVIEEINILRALSWLLGKEFEVFTTLSASQGRDWIGIEDFDVVICDQSIAEINGVDFLDQVRELAPRASRILLTDQSTSQVALGPDQETGIFRLVTKPWDVTELPSIIAEAVQIARQPKVAHDQPAASHPEPASSRQPKILVLDEDETTHSMVEMSGGDLAQIIHVTNPVDAFKMLEDEEIGVMLSERWLGSMDLAHLLCLIKRKHPLIVSVMITNADDSNPLPRLINEEQIYRIIPKPIKASTLRQALKSALKKRKELLEKSIRAERRDTVEMPFKDEKTEGSDVTVSLVRPASPSSPAPQSEIPNDSTLQKVGDIFRRLFGV